LETLKELVKLRGFGDFFTGRESQCKVDLYYIRLLKAPTSGANPVAPTVGALGQTTGNIAHGFDIPDK